MAKKKKEEKEFVGEENPNAHILGAGEVVNQLITETLEVNYMPYAMSVIMSRAIPEIDGFKPAHRKLLYTMYKMGLLTGARVKSATPLFMTRWCVCPAGMRRCCTRSLIPRATSARRIRAI